jgi:hypothetical protein
VKLTKQQAREWGLLDPAKAARRKRRPRDRKPASDALFDALCKEHGLPVPVQEYPFAPPRKWRADYCFEDWLLVEKVGGVWTRGHHSRGQTQIDDMTRRNEAQILGFCVLEFTPEQFDDGSAFAVIRRALEAREERP